MSDQAQKPKYEFVPANDPVAWSHWVENSPQGTIFHRADFLQSTGRKFKTFWIKKGEEIRAGISFVVSHDECAVELDDLVIHQGLIFSPEDTRQKPCKQRAERFEITEETIQWLVSRFRSAQLSLSPEFEDLRPFLWHQYHSENALEKFAINLRYTSYLDLSSLKDCTPQNEEENPAFRALEVVRQRNIREARKSGAKVEILRETGTALNDAIEIYLSFYQKLMTAQGKSQTVDRLAQIRTFCAKLVDAGLATLYLARTPNGAPTYVLIQGHDQRRSYYLLGSGDPQERERYAGTFAFWESFRDLAARGLIQADFEGVNSPKRGAFKLGFGGTLNPYFELSWNPRGKLEN